MSVIALVGAQWGDEGKGKIIDIMSANADVVVRAMGGDNAGHTVVVGGQTYKLHLIPSGILYKNAICVIGNGTVINPKSLIAEMDSLISRGIDISGLRIDERAHIIFPHHIIIDEMNEKLKGAGDIGTTKKGIGPCYMDKAERTGLRICDLISGSFTDKLRVVVDAKNHILSNLYGASLLDFDALLNQYKAYADRLRGYVCDTSALVYNAIKQNKRVLLEGAQGALLDLDLGTYPYVTSSHPTTGGFCVGAGIGPTLIDECIGISKAYTTRVGKGPFPTELDDEIGNYIRENGLEFGTTTGRPRRCGWLDLVILRFAVRINGLTQLVVNKLDTLSGIDILKICVDYECDGKLLSDFPSNIEKLQYCKPIYKEFKGWKQDISGVRNYDDLPNETKTYVSFIEENIGCRITMAGVGSKREQSLNR
ncbi:adenylosuccinate synthetase [Holotrichia oblita]|nr:adenylosuccinate synthetase [Holotrichia oblita]